MRTLARTLLAFVLAVAVVVVLLPRPAQGCSCAGPGDISSAIDEAQAAFVGTHVEKTVGGGGEFGTTAVHRFEVEQWVKGDLGPMIDVHTAADGAACGFEFPEGARIGAFLYREGDHLASSLCSQVDPDVLIAASEGPAWSETGVPFLLVGGWSSPRMKALDADGNLVRYLDSRSSPEEWALTDPTSLSVCPGRELMVHRTNSQLVVWNLTTLDEVSATPLPDFVDAGVYGVSCRTEDASEVWYVVDGVGGPVVARVIPDLAELISLPHPQVFFGPNHVVTMDYESTRVSRTDLATGETVLLYDKTEVSPDLEFVGLTAAPNPTDGPTAVLETVYEPSPGSVLRFYDSSGSLLSEHQIPYESGGPVWIDDTRLTVNAWGYENPNDRFLYVFELASGSETTLSGWSPWQVVGAPDGVYGFENGTLWRADLDELTVEQVVNTSSQDATALLVLPGTEKIVVDPESEPTGPVTPPLTLDDGIEVLSGGSTPETQGGATNLARFAFFGVVGLGVVGAAAWLISKRRSASGGDTSA